MQSGLFVAAVPSALVAAGPFVPVAAASTVVVPAAVASLISVGEENLRNRAERLATRLAAVESIASCQITDEIKKGDSGIIRLLNFALPDHVLVSQVAFYFDDQIYFPEFLSTHQPSPGIQTGQPDRRPVPRQTSRLGIEAGTGSVHRRSGWRMG